MSVSPVSTSYSAPPAPAAEEDSGTPPVKNFTGNTQVDVMIAEGTASLLYGCTTTLEILDRLTGKTKDSEEPTSSAASGTLAAMTQAGLW